ncbi:MAG TPA: hypothetical protein EYH05_12940 [Anaerolineae bacterium]|nr:hypothetical protein [Anaerolineae bacterium]
MRQPINFTQTDLDEFAEKATGLSDWLEEETRSGARRVTIPPKLTTVTSFVITSGLLMFLDGRVPTSYCWGGGCAL